MCGGKYPKWETPRQLTQIRGEPIVARTIRLLNLYGVNDTDICISSDSKEFERFGVQVLHHSVEITMTFLTSLLSHPYLSQLALLQQL